METINSIVASINQWIRNSTNITDGKAEKYADVVDGNDVRAELLSQLEGSGLEDHLSFVNNGNTLKINNCGIIFFLKRKRVKVGTGFRISSFMTIDELEIRHDHKTLTDKALVEVLNSVTLEIKDNSKREEANRAVQIDRFNSNLDALGLPLEDFLSIQKEFNVLPYPVKLHFENSLH